MHNVSYRPSLLDHVPHTRRGHGTTHPQDRFDEKTGRRLRNACRCVEVTCEHVLPRKKNGDPQGDLHRNQKANADDWKEERGLSPHLSFEQCFGVRV